MKKIFIIILIMIFTLSSCNIFTDEYITYDDGMYVHFIDVGQGDCILITCEDETMLIDSGTSQNAESIIGYLDDLGIDTIDVLVGTHPHADHIGSMAKIIKFFDIGSVLLPEIQHNTKTFENMLDAIIEKDIDVISPYPGDSFQFGDAMIYVLAPYEIDSNNLNNNSIVLRIEHNNNSFLFTGDAEKEIEMQIIDSGMNIDSDVLKMGHHGSSTSTSQEFFDAVSPDIAVIQLANDNEYGHPHKETIEKLNSTNVQVYRNDLHGNIVLYSDGNDITLSKAEVNNDNVQYIGNTSSLKFHLDICSSLPNLENQIILYSREDAISNNYIPCGLCNP